MALWFREVPPLATVLIEATPDTSYILIHYILIQSSQIGDADFYV